MTQIIAASIGSYPRVGEEKDQQRHRRAFQHLQTGELSQHAFKDVQHSIIQEIIREQLEAGLDEVTDGQVTWDDPITKFCHNVKGIKITGLARFFDANFYYRVPVITGKPKKSGSFLADDLKIAREISPKPVRAVLTGPFTLAAHTVSTTKPYSHFLSRLSLFTDFLAEEVAQLAGLGATVIQIDEPSLPLLPQYLSQAGKIFRRITENVANAKTALALYFSPLAPILKDLQDLPFDTVHLDFSGDEKRLWESLLRCPFPKNVGFGILDARTTKLEPIDPIITLIQQWVNAVHPPYVYVTPSTGLEYLPRTSAQAKIKLLGKIKTELTLALQHEK